MKKKFGFILTLLTVLCLCFGLAACGEEDTYTVSFTGEEISVPAQTVKAGECAIEPKEPTRDGFEFAGWFLNDEKYSFSTPVTQDITLTGTWEEEVVEEGATMRGTGTQDDPYTIANADQLVDFSNKVNSGEGNYLSAFYRLTADIDMADKEYEPAGKVTEDEDENELDYRFTGSFDGNGKTISNLTLTRIAKKGNVYLGLFGRTHLADIRNLTVEFTANAESYTDTISAYVGGVVGYAELTNFTKVNAIGTIETSMLEANPTYLGGIAGGLSANTYSGQSYVVYVENCYADVTTTIGEEGSHENGAVGGLFGYVLDYSSTVAIINCATTGSLRGGMYAGGLVGTISDYVSIINCTSSASVRGTAKEVTYAGGLVGSASGDSIIMDSFATGAVTGKEANSNVYSSYVGGVVGYAISDNYDYYYEAGTAIVNCYYSGRITANRAIKSTYGEEVDASAFTAEFLTDTLGWMEEVWSIGETYKPTQTLAIDVKTDFTVTLQSKGQTVDTLERNAESGYAFLDEIERLDHNSPELFFSWELAEGAMPRFYVPVVKDMTLTARWQDVSGIVGAYKGTGLLNDSEAQSYDGGSIVLDENGGMQWIADTISRGTYIYNGENIVFNVGSNGEMSGTITPNALTFYYDMGMTGYMSYTFTPFEPEIIGEFVSPNGDLLTFVSEGTMTFQSTTINNGNFVNGTYTIEGDTITVNCNTTGAGKMGGWFSSMVIERDGNVLTVDATAKSGVSYELDGVKFTQYGSVDYSGEEFLGTYSIAYISSTNSNPVGFETFYVDHYTIEFLANGTVLYRTLYSTVQGRYYYSEENGTVKLILDGYATEFTYDEGADVLQGKFHRGTTVKFPMVLTKTEAGDLYAYAITDRANVVFVCGETTYFVKDGEWDKTATVSGTFANDELVTVNGERYRVKIFDFDEDRDYRQLLKVGDEMGDYTYDGLSFSLDGNGNVTGGKEGTYLTYDNVVVILFSDDQIIGFDYAAAQNAQGAVTLAQTDGYQGIWYHEGTSWSTGETYDKYQKLIIDGYGNATLMYLYDVENGVYRHNWSGWGTYTVNASGITVQFNSSHKADFQLYYDGNLLYTKSDTWLYREMSFIKDGYTGSTTPPVFPVEWAGAYVVEGQTDVVFNLRDNLTGSYLGSPISNVSYDGDKTVYFRAYSKTHAVVFGTTITLTPDGESAITLARRGNVEEVFPAVLCGQWQGLFEGYGANDTRSIFIKATGEIVYAANNDEASGTYLSQVNYDGATGIITAVSGGLEFELTYDMEEETLSVEITDDEYRTWTATLTKVVS